jgi:hypothetical protein
VKVAEQWECCTGLDKNLAGRVKATTQKLNMVGKGSFASTEIEGDIVESICMQNLELFMRGNRVGAVHADMLQLYSQAESFEGNLQKVISIPHLIDHEKQTN